MRTLVIYYSRSGHTKSVAERIARATAADVEEIVEVEPPSGNVRAALDAIFKRKPPTRPFQRSLDDYDLVVIGTPIWRMNAVPAIQAFLPTQDWSGRDVALFCTMGGMGDKKAFRTMRGLTAGSHIVGELGLDGAALADAQALDGRLGAWVEGLSAQAK